MKKVTILCALLLSCFIANGAEAKPHFVGPRSGEIISTAKEASIAQEDASIYLEGNLIEQIGNDEYLFKDTTGTIPVEIDDEIWPFYTTITPETRISIQGSIDIDDFAERKMEVDRLDLL